MTNIMAYIVIPFFALYFSRDSHLLKENFSVLGNMSGRRIPFLILGLVLSLYFYLALNRLISALYRLSPGNGREKDLRQLCKKAALFLEIGFLLPYAPKDLALFSFFHVIYSFAASLLLLFCLYRIVWEAKLYISPWFCRYAVALNLITLISALLYLLSGIISSAMEIFYIISCSILIRKLEVKLTS